ncbi:hypothetical protein PPERSA_03725 [Pseudocohnilembus persalinus]|uniref:t-SNARE coiled-coil homology domain-containing protein n=1 Tax=Pseudocohnilembus persalinus TaxID=266149 RepID=A0A0V0QHD1_PSEPJ|nr:hypothetical protein PPERSA_03725 [Pseudocohnilembus persalinus]|eukprot:KRX01641.1 hypothetical protein PPERSA_03725 [Pseudocohnilembus persalinus]
MGDFEEFERNIVSSFEKTQRELGLLGKKDPTAKKNTLDKIKKWLDTNDALIESFKIEIDLSEPQEQGKHIQTYNNMKQRAEKLKKDYQAQLNKGTGNQQQLFENNNYAKNVDPNQMTAAEMIQVGDQTQEKTDLALNNIIMNVNRMEDVADGVIIELDKQIEQLDRMYDTVKDTQSELKRTKRYLKYFAKNMYTDKLIMCLIFLVIAAIIALAVLTAMGYGDDKTSESDTIDTDTTTSEVTE